MIKLKVLVPLSITWRPGQHVFLRIPALSLLDNHPFTIASAPSLPCTRGEEQSGDSAHTLTFLIRPHDGFTSKLLSYINSNADASLSVHLDGPYGGFPRRLENAYDSIILVAGGGGITASPSWLAYLAPRLAAGGVTTANVRLIWVVRKRVHLEWAKEEIDHVSATVPKGTFVTEYHVTNDAEVAQISSENDASASQAITRSTSVSESKSSQEIQRGRPNLADCIARALVPGSRMCVLGCGPESMKIDLSNAVVRAQRRVLRGELKEIKLETETFGW